MTLTVRPWHSVSTRITLTTLIIFLMGIWSLSYYASRMLRRDTERLLGEQQFTTVSFIAAGINQELDGRLRALEKIAARVGPSIVGNPATLQTLLDAQPILQSLFNGGVIAYRPDGTAVAETLLSAGRIGVNYMNLDAIAAALEEGKSTIGRPLISKELGAAAFSMATPIRDTQGKVIGALAGEINLSKPSFLDQITAGRYGKTGRYLLNAPQYRLIVTSSDKSRVMQPLPAPGTSPLLERYIRGYEGYGIFANFRGVEELTAAKGIPVAGWFMGIALPTAEAFAPIRAMQRRMLLATLFLTLLAGGLTWWILRRQLSPLLAAATSLAAITNTDQHPQPLPVTSKDEIGQLIGGFNRVLEILGQQKEALKKSETFKQAILNSVAVEIAVLDRDGVILDVNEPWRRFALENCIESGKPPSGSDVGANYMAACQPDTSFTTDEAKGSRDGIQAVQEGRLPSFKLEYPCHSPQQQRWFSMSVTPLGDAAPGGVVITHTNITERKQAEQASRIAAIAFECQEGIVVMDANLKILRINQAFTHITGYSAQEVEGKTTAILRPKRHPASFYEDVWSEIKRTGAWQGDMWQRRKNGDEYPARITTTAVRDELAQVTHYVDNITDATLSQLQEQQRLLNEAAHRDILIREVHHRIKNNLQGITGILRQFAQKHPETTEPINQAIGQVKSISVIHGLQGSSVTSSVRVCELTNTIANEIQSLWQMPIVMDIPPKWLPCVIAEKEAVPIALVLNELILNAVKHGGKEHGNVRIALRKDRNPGVVQIRITNAGQLAPDQWHYGGAYSGLQLVSALMPQHGARIVREQLGNQVITMLELESPIISPDPKWPA